MPRRQPWEASRFTAGSSANDRNSATISMPVFTAPGAITQRLTISFTLVVTDQLGFASEPSHVVITVEPYGTHLPVVYKP